MAAFEVLSLDPAVPQIRAPGAGDTYSVPREMAISVNSASDALRITQTGAGNALVVEDSANPDATPFVVNASGNVGIGTTAPQAVLDLGSGSSGRAITWSATASTRYASIFTAFSAADIVLGYGFHGSSSADSYLSSWTGTLANAGVRVGTGTVQFFTNTATAQTAGNAFTPTERMRITSAGELLVGGTTSLNAAPGWLALETANNSAGINIFRNDTTVTSGNVLGDIRFVGNDTTSNTPTILARVNAVASGTHDPGTNPTDLTFATTPSGSATVTERMRLDGSGNLGLGVTPSAWSLGKAIEVGNLGNALWGIDSSNVVLGANIYYGSGALKYANTAAASFYQQSAGVHSWYTAPSGTAGNTITFTQAMTLDASGNLGVGATSPARKLHVSGSAAYARLTDSDTGVGGSVEAALEFYASDGQKASIGYPGNDDFLFNVVDNKNLRFYTNNTERARITAGGYFKASNNGTYLSSTGAYHELRNDANANTVRISNSIASGYTDAIIQTQFSGYTPNAATAWFLFCDDTTNQKAGILSTGTFESRTGTYGGVSDVKLKTNIVDANSQWDDLKSVRVRNFEFKDEPENTMLGVVAQEIEEVSPGLVYETPDRDKEGNDLGTTTKSVKYSVLYMKAVKALQEAMARIEQLEAKVAALESK